MLVLLNTLPQTWEESILTASHGRHIWYGGNNDPSTQLHAKPRETYQPSWPFARCDQIERWCIRSGKRERLAWHFEREIFSLVWLKVAAVAIFEKVKNN